MATKKIDNEKELEIQKSMEKLGLSRQEAEEMWAFDHDEVDCEEVDAMEAEIKDKIKSKKKGSSLDKVRNLKAKKKADKEKQAIISMIFEEIIQMAADGEIVNPQEMGSTKMSFKGVDGGYYSVTITKHKSCPDGYKD